MIHDLLRNLCCCCLLLVPMPLLAADEPQEVRRLTGFVAPVGRISFSPDGRLMLTSSLANKNEFKTQFGDCRIWNVGTGELVLKLPTDANTSVWDAKFSPNGDRIVTTGMVGTANGWKSDCHLWSANGKRLADLTAQQIEASYDIWFTPDGKQLVTNAFKKITVADANTGRQMRKIESLKTRNACALSPDGRLFASGIEDGTSGVHVWEFATGRLLHKTRETRFPAEELCFSRSGSHLLISSFEAAELLELPTFKVIASLGDMRHGGFSPDGRLIATAHWTSRIHVWETATGRELLQFKGHPHHQATAVFHPDGKHLICGGGSDQKDDFGKPSKSFDAYIYRLPDSILSQRDVVAAPTRTALPPKDELDKARAEIKEIFDADFSKAKKPEAKLELAERLFAEASKSEATVARYVLLHEARQLAMSSAGVDVVDQTFEMLSAFDADFMAARVESIKALSISTKNPADLTKLSSLCLESIELAIVAEQFEGAADLLKSANVIQTKSKDSTLRDNIKQAQDRTAHRKKQLEDMQAAQEILAKTADDSAAHEKVGRYLCLAKGDWNNGLSHLSIGNDAKLKAAAIADLSSPPEAVKQTEVGDAWFEAAKLAKPVDKVALMSRAKHWYELAAPLATGLTKIRIEARLKELTSNSKPDKSRPSGK